MSSCPFQEICAHGQGLAAVGRETRGFIHDLRSQITIPKGYVEIMRMDPTLSNNFRHYLEEMGRAIQEMERLCNHMQRIAQASGGPSSQAPTQVASLIRGVIQITRGLCQELNGAPISISYQPLVDGIVLVDGLALQRVLTNLVVNAIQAMPAGGTLTIRTEKQENQIRICIVDTGIGMDNDTLDHCLDYGFTTKGVSTNNNAEHGIGLAMARESVHQMGGELQINSEVAVGTTVTVTLPLVDDTIPYCSEGETIAGQTLIQIR